MATFCSDKLMVWGRGGGGSLCGKTALLGSVRWEPNRRTMPPACLSRAAAANKPDASSYDRVNSTMAADVSRRCPAKIKDSATNAINKLGVGGTEKRFEEEFQRRQL